MPSIIVDHELQLRSSRFNLDFHVIFYSKVVPYDSSRFTLIPAATPPRNNVVEFTDIP